MQETTSHKYAVGIDTGSSMVRCVIGHIDASNGNTTIVGIGSAPTSGMRKGNVIDLTSLAKAIDSALADAERMSGHQVESATININGAHLLSTNTDGMVTVSGANQEVTMADLGRVEDMAISGKVPANREVLDVIPHQYRLDGQGDIKNPIGMSGTRLEVEANVISALKPNLENLCKVYESVKVSINNIVVSGVAAAKAVLDEKQLENGVLLLDIGASTTNLAIFEEGDLHYISVVPLGGINITNDLAIGLRVDPEIAEKVKLEHASAMIRDSDAGVSMKIEKDIQTFSLAEIDEIVDARLEEIFEAVKLEVRRAGKLGKLPAGVVLTGGTAHLKGLVGHTKGSLGLAAKIGIPTGYVSAVDGLDESSYATAIGLMMYDAQIPSTRGQANKNNKNKPSRPNILSGLLKKFRS